MKLLALIFSHLGPHRRTYLMGMAAVLIEGLAAAAPMIIAGMGLVVLARGHASPSNIWPYSAAILLAVLVRLAVVRAAWLHLFLGGNEVTLRVRDRIADHMRSVPLGILQRWAPARLANLLSEDARWINEAATIGASLLLVGIVTGIVLLLGAVWYEPLVGLSATAAVVLSLPVLTWAGRLLARTLQQRVTDVAEGNQRIGEYADGIAVYRSFGRIGAALETYQRAARQMRDTMLDSAPRLSIVGEAGRGVLHLAVPLALGVVAALLAHVTVTTAAIPALLLVLAGVAALSAALAQGALIGTAGKAAQEITRFLDEPVLQGRGRVERASAMALSFESVTFGYGAAASGPPAVRDISFTALPGTTTALVGSSGAGKSTIAALLLRFFDVSSGRITLADRDIRDLDPADLQAAIAFVGQDVHLFRDTLRANILLGDPAASEERLTEVVTAARLTELVDALPNGLDTVVGDSGRTLSGGERQRVAIARALLKSAPVVLLDEATSAVDPINELAIAQALAALVRGRTLIVIAHRLRTITGAGQILVLNEGRIVETGRHEALWRAGGTYARLWAAQMRTTGWSIRS